jgi:hypothetical protein
MGIGKLTCTDPINPGHLGAANGGGHRTTKSGGGGLRSHTPPLVLVVKILQTINLRRLVPTPTVGEKTS